MNNDLKEFVQKWIVKAEHDFISAKTIFKYEPMILDNVCFHCQQSVEKYLKAFLIYKKQEIEKTHSVDYLLKKCAKLDKDFEKLDMENLEDYAVKGRYPTDLIDPSAEKVKQYLKIVSITKKLVLSKIKL